MKTAKSISVVLFVLLTAQIASAYYCPSTGRWLSRDPIGEPGFQALQTATRAPRIGSSTSSQTARWIQRDPIPKNDEPNFYEFVGNNPIIVFDRLGLCSCGPDVTQTIANTLANVQTEWDSSDSATQKKTCAYLNTPSGWDMGELLGANFTSPCKASGACSHTVTVNGVCYLGSEVNYVLYGKMCALCNMSQPVMDGWILGNKLGYKPFPTWLGGLGQNYDQQLRGALAWANAGYAGWPGNPLTPYSDKGSCSPCSYVYLPHFFLWHAGAIGFPNFE